MSDAKKVVIQGARCVEMHSKTDGPNIRLLKFEFEYQPAHGVNVSKSYDITITPAKPKRVKKTVWLVRDNFKGQHTWLSMNGQFLTDQGQASPFYSLAHARAATYGTSEYACVIKRTYWVPA